MTFSKYTHRTPRQPHQPPKAEAYTRYTNPKRNQLIIKC